LLLIYAWYGFVQVPSVGGTSPLIDSLGVVVRKGWLFIEDKVVPTPLIDMAIADRVQLRAGVQNLDDLPPFEETYYVPSGETTGDTYPERYAPPLYWYPPVGAGWPGYYTGYYGYPMCRISSDPTIFDEYTEFTKNAQRLVEKTEQ
jgi:hypothetical protein